MTPSSSFRERRARIRLVRERLDHAADSLDAGMLGTRGFLEALRKSRPVPPPVLWGPDFLEQVYERAARDSARKLGPGVLRHAFAPSMVPEDVEWAHSTDRPGMVELLRAALPRHRVRLHRPATGRPARTHPARRWVGGIAAAMLVAVGAFAFFNGTSSPPELVFVVTDRPLTQDHPLAD